MMKWLQTRPHSKGAPHICQKLAATGNVGDANNAVYWALAQMVGSFKIKLFFTLLIPEVCMSGKEHPLFLKLRAERGGCDTPETLQKQLSDFKFSNPIVDSLFLS